MDFLEGIGVIMADLARSSSSMPAITRSEKWE